MNPSPALEKTAEILSNTPIGTTGFFLKKKDAIKLAEDLDKAGVLKKRLS